MILNMTNNAGLNRVSSAQNKTDLNLCDVCYWRKRAEKQTTELEALRGFANAIYEYYSASYRKSEVFNELAIKHKLIDENGQPTGLLKGESE